MGKERAQTLENVEDLGLGAWLMGNGNIISMKTASIRL